MERDSKAVEEGVDAYCLGVARDACPYDPASQEHLDWASWLGRG